MSLQNKSMYAILGILNISPGTGYDIKKYSDNVLAGFWNENFGHIYPTLSRMAETGLIEVIPNKEKDRRICYRITEAGKEELQSWLGEKTQKQPIRSEFMLKLLFSDCGNQKSVIGMLESFQQEHEVMQNAYREMESEIENGINGLTKERSILLKSVLRRGILSCDTDIRWSRECITNIKEAGIL